MNSPQFIGAFIKARHYNFSVFFCTQHWKKLPKICRMQASYLCFFAISNNEAECLAEEFAPPRMPKNNFMQLIDDALKEPFSFLTVNMKAPWETRFRRGLAQVINLDHYRKGVISTPSSQDSSSVCEQTDDERPDPLEANQ